MLDGMAWSVVSVAGTMASYLPTGSFLYERLIAATETPGTATFIILVSDGAGYIGTIAVLAASTLLADPGCSDGGNGGSNGTAAPGCALRVAGPFTAATEVVAGLVLVLSAVFWGWAAQLRPLASSYANTAINSAEEDGDGDGEDGAALPKPPAETRV